MRTRLIGNLLLLLAAIALASVLYLKPWAEPPDPAPRLTDLDPKSVQRIEIARKGADAETIVLRREGEGAWRVTKPFAARARQSRVDSLLSALRQRTKDHFPAKGRDLAQFGLKAPTATVRAGGTTVALGGKAPTERAVYVRAGDTIHLVDTGLTRKLDREPTGFAARSLLPSGAKITAIETDSFTVERAKSGAKRTWRVTGGGKKAAKDAGKRIARAWRTARAERVERRTRGEPPKPAIRVSVEGREAPYAFARMAAKDGDRVVLTRPGHPLRYLVSKATAERLFTLKQAAKSDAKTSKETKSGAS